MKRRYLKPEQQIIELQESTVICSSAVDGLGGGFTDFTVDDDSDYFVD